MKKQNTLATLATVPALFFALLLTAGCVTAQSTQKGGGRLEGAWDVRVSIVNCQTGAVIRSFDSITQFMQGGTLMDSTSGTAQQLKTPGQGVWAHTTGNSYVFRFKSFTFDAANTYTGYTIVHHDAEMDPSGDSYTSTGGVEIYTPNGTRVGTGCSTTTATRFEL